MPSPDVTGSLMTSRVEPCAPSSAASPSQVRAAAGWLAAVAASMTKRSGLVAIAVGCERDRVRKVAPGRVVGNPHIRLRRGDDGGGVLSTGNRDLNVDTPRTDGQALRNLVQYRSERRCRDGPNPMRAIPWRLGTQDRVQGQMPVRTRLRGDHRTACNQQDSDNGQQRV